MQMGHYRKQELGKNPGSGGQAKRENVTLIDNEFALRIPEGKPKIPPMGQMNRHMQIGILHVQQHHPSTVVKILNNRVEGLHMELGDNVIRVEPREVENGVEPTSMLGSQEAMGIHPPLPTPPHPHPRS